VGEDRAGRGITAGELAELLSAVPPHVRVIVKDHFGRAREFTVSDFEFVRYRKGELPSGLVGDFVVVHQIDIGPEPE
jgi:hypothetical protein